MAPWTFLTNHAAVLGYLSRHPRITAREIAAAVGITERATRKIIADLEADGYISKQRQGRRSVYGVASHLPLRHTAHRDIAVGEVLKVLAGKRTRRGQRGRSETQPEHSK